MFTKRELGEIEDILDGFSEFCSKLGGRFSKETDLYEEISAISEISAVCVLPEEREVSVDISHLRSADEVDVTIRAGRFDFEMELDFGNKVDFESNMVDRVYVETSGESYRNVIHKHGRIIRLVITPRITAKGGKQNWKIKVE